MIPTVFLSVILSALSGAGIFYLVYFFVVEFSKFPVVQNAVIKIMIFEVTVPGRECQQGVINISKTVETGQRLRACAGGGEAGWQS